MTNIPSKPPTLTDADFVRAAKTLRCDVSAIRAVAEVESRGGGFIYYDSKSEWRPKILFERHVMYRQYRKRFGHTKAIARVAKYPDIINTRSGGYKGGDAEHDRMQKARTLISNTCAMESASWGMFQIMGYHWSYLGYESVLDFVLTMSKGEAEQLDAFVRFIKKDKNLLNAIRSKDWQLFARTYNGRAYKKNRYDVKMNQAEKKWRAKGVNDITLAEIVKDEVATDKPDAKPTCATDCKNYEPVTKG